MKIRTLYKLRVMTLLFLFVYPLKAECSEIARATLENGLRVVVIRNTLAPVVTTVINYLVGSNEDPEGYPGMAHAREHMMFRGSRGLNSQQLSAIIAAMGGEFNADTQQTVTQYFFTVPSEDLDVALRVEALRMRNVLDTEELWKGERGAIEQEVSQDLSNPEYLLYSKLLSIMFAKTPYARDALGTRDSFQKTTASMLKKFHRDWYGPNNAILVIAGDVDLFDTLEKVKRIFSGIPSRSTPVHPEVYLRELSPESIAFETDLPTGLAVVAYRLPGYDSPDYSAGQILADVLDSKRGNIYALVPEGRALDADFTAIALPRAALGYATAAFPLGGNAADLISGIKEIISDYVKDGFPPDLMEASKRHEIADEEFRMNSVESLASEWSQALAVEGRNSPEEDIESLKRVTAEDVNRVAREWLVNSTAITAVLTPRHSGKPMPSRSFPGKESFAPSQVKPVPLPAWAKKAASLPPVPEDKHKPADMLLSNGIRLIVMPEGVSRTVSVFGRIKNNPDLQVPDGQEGVDDLLSDMFSYGTKTLDRLAFQKAIDDIAANLAAGTDFSLQVLRENFESGIKLLAENLLQPALPASAFKVMQTELMDKVAGLLQSPSYNARRALHNALYPRGDPALREATPETVKALTLQNVQAYYQKVFRPDMTTIVIIGMVTPEDAKQSIEKYFGSWKTTEPKPETDFPPVPQNKTYAISVPDTSRIQTLVMLEETVGLKRADPDYYALQLGTNVLSGAFYATRLYRDLREKRGLVYYVEADLESKKARSLFGVYYACDPQNVSRATSIVEKDLVELQRKPLGFSELKQARTLLVRRIALNKATVNGIAQELLSLSEEGLPLDEPVRAAKNYLGMTAQRIKSAFSKWIRPKGFVQVTLGPAPR